MAFVRHIQEMAGLSCVSTQTYRSASRPAMPYPCAQRVYPNPNVGVPRGLLGQDRAI